MYSSLYSIYVRGCVESGVQLEDHDELSNIVVENRDVWVVDPHT